MPIAIVNQHLERRLAGERDRRGKKTLAGTVEELLIERLTQIEIESTSERRNQQPAEVANGQ